MEINLQRVVGVLLFAVTLSCAAPGKLSSRTQHEILTLLFLVFFYLFLMVLAEYSKLFLVKQNFLSGCQTYDPSLAPLTHSVCAPFISAQVSQQQPAAHKTANRLTLIIFFM